MKGCRSALRHHYQKPKGDSPMRLSTLKLAMCFVFVVLSLVSGVAACDGPYFEPSNGITWSFNASGGTRTDGACQISGGYITCNNGFQATANLSPSITCYTMTTEQPWLYFQKLKTQTDIDAWTAQAKKARQFVNDINTQRKVVCGAVGVIDRASKYLCNAGYFAFMAEMAQYAYIFEQAAADPPDPNFTVIPTPVFPNLTIPIPTGVDAATVAFFNSGNALLTNISQQLGYADAGVTAFNRASGAATLGGGVTWWQQQAEASNGFFKQVGIAAAAEPTLLTNFQNSFWDLTSHTSFAASQTDYLNSVADLNANGVPADLLADFAVVGDQSTLTAEFVADVNDPSAINDFPNSFPELLTDPGLISSLTNLATVLGAETPFSAFSGKFQTTATSFELTSAFTLGAGSNGINPVSEVVSLQIGTFTETIPSGSFKKAKAGYFVFSGTINGVAQQIIIKPGTTNGSYSFAIDGMGVNLSALPNPVTVVLNVGDDLGVTQVTH
jgi:hypothetical protein